MFFALVGPQLTYRLERFGTVGDIAVRGQAVIKKVVLLLFYNICKYHIWMAGTGKELLLKGCSLGQSAKPPRYLGSMFMFVILS